MNLVAYVDKRSKNNAGKPLYPHLHKDKKYIASHTRYEVDYVKVETLEQLEALVRMGYGARMSNKSIGSAPSLIVSKNIDCIGSSNVEEELKKAILNTNLDVESKTKRRIEQTLLRSFLLQGKPFGKCVICDNELPENMLVAAHIKKRSECTNHEKLDFSNIASLMCKLGCDDFFEKGYVFIKEGLVTRNLNVRTTIRLEEALSKIDGNQVKNWKNSRIYYQWHAKQWAKSA
ncbi:hypothetical protein ACF3NA_00095 [Alkanindiges sp. WGS2144]|uniref:hypothetical protein n=1 Tax=Alkanindiges sp. WGS2144 TaxID=3366808 RepID=UPI00375348B9